MKKDYETEPGCEENEGEIQQEIDRTEKLISGIHSAISDLATRISSILRDVPDGSNPREESIPCASPLGRVMKDQNDSLENAIERLNCIKRKVEL